MIQMLLFNDRVLESLSTGDPKHVKTLMELGVRSFIDLTGRIKRLGLEKLGFNVMTPRKDCFYEYWALIEAIRDILLSTNSRIHDKLSLVSASTIWCLARRDYGVDTSIAIYQSFIYLSEISRLANRPLIVWVEEWFQRKHEYVYVVLKRLSTSIKSILL